uniref:(northern house mosquito) hypothetical protein n=1 Tax=Culex pipiens TaxID=7175 RepID=A0A8D8JLQ4_CULPI
MDRLAGQTSNVCWPILPSDCGDQQLLTGVIQHPMVVRHHDLGEWVLMMQDDRVLATLRNWCVRQPAADAHYSVYQPRVERKQLRRGLNRLLLGQIRYFFGKTFCLGHPNQKRQCFS